MTEFRAAEAAAISGVSQVQQRNWRRRGYLPRDPGGRNARFTLEDVLRLFVMQALSEDGVSPATAQRIAPDIAVDVRAAVMWRLSGKRAYSTVVKLRLGPFCGVEIDMDAVALKLVGRIHRVLAAREARR